MSTPKITKDCVKPLFETKFIKLFDLQYEKGKHYFDATRRSANELIAVKSSDDYKTLLPDAVTCIVILNPDSDSPKLLLSKEFRYPAGQFLLSPPAGLIDPEDAACSCPTDVIIKDSNIHDASITNALISAALREIEEETGLTSKKDDVFSIINPFLFSTPGMTDESNGLVLAKLTRDDLSTMNQDGAVGSECFDGFVLVTQEDARSILKAGRDDKGIYYSVYTWAALTYFVADLWR